MPVISARPPITLVERPATPGASLTRVDLLVYATLAAIGVMHYAMTLRASEFFTGDTIYFELAQGLLSHGYYGFNFRPETVLPPGFPAILASLCLAVGCTYPVFIHTVVV